MVFRRNPWIRLGFSAALALLGGSAAPAARAAELDRSAECRTPDRLLADRHGLPHVAERIARGLKLRIVALGSSSTEGVGASSPDNAYPARLQVELQALLPRAPVEVVNKGVGGEKSHHMLARFPRDVLAEKPDLAIWQAGVNSALGREGVESLADDLASRIRLAHDSGIDIMLMNQQPAPRFEALADREDYVRHLGATGDRLGAPVFRRYEIMKYWARKGQLSPQAMIGADGLHLTDRGYGCVAKALARMIVRLAQPKGFASR